MRFSPAFLLAAALMPAVRTDAHHSLNATYIVDQQQGLRGTVRKFLVQNPHSYILLDAPDSNGLMQQWQIEWSPAGILASQGIRKDTLKAGDRLELVIAPAKDGSWHGGLLRIIRRPSDGFEWGTKPGEVVPNWMALNRK